MHLVPLISFFYLYVFTQENWIISHSSQCSYWCPEKCPRKKSPPEKCPRENCHPENYPLEISPPRKLALGKMPPRKSASRKNAPRKTASRKIVSLDFCCFYYYLTVPHFKLLIAASFRDVSRIPIVSIIDLLETVVNGSN